ncbi:hypothetical protein CDAR_109531 [Caerostris darwini]|uniref:Uncharacterized protein n=1 Tax=Caerostris darwini TaxID=1538125 RepID=A0AAV4SX27_9ARAC|nr:hypothetical protein CDAR_109531 [Caerostris darwini]
MGVMLVTIPKYPLIRGPTSPLSDFSPPPLGEGVPRKAFSAASTSESRSPGTTPQERSPATTHKKRRKMQNELPGPPGILSGGLKGGMDEGQRKQEKGPMQMKALPRDAVQHERFM